MNCEEKSFITFVLEIISGLEDENLGRM